MQKRKLKKQVQKKLAKKAGVWAVKTILTSLPVVGIVFKLLFAAADVAKEIRATIKEEAAKSKQRAPRVPRAVLVAA